MSILHQLAERVNNDSAWGEQFATRIDHCRQLATAIHLVHVCGNREDGRGVDFIKIIKETPHHIPTSADCDYYSDETRVAEDSIGSPRSAYFYAGRACPEFGNVALVFGPEAESGHTGSATPFDTGGVLHPNQHLAMPAGHDDDQARVRFVVSSQIALRDWRDGLANFLAAYFERPQDYWGQGPNRPDPDGFFEANPRNWRAWVFEVRFFEGQSIHDRATWCARPSFVERLEQLLRDEGPRVPGHETPLQRFWMGASPLDPAGTDRFCNEVEAWIRSSITA